MQHNPSWEANRFSFNQEIPHILLIQNVHYRIHTVNNTAKRYIILAGTKNKVMSPTRYFKQPAPTNLASSVEWKVRNNNKMGVQP